MNTRRKFHLDRRNGKLFGVCAGIADYFNIDATIVRIGVVAVTLLGAFPWSLVAYGIVAFLAKRKPEGEEEVRTPRLSTAQVRDSIRDIDRRMAEVDSYVTSSNSRLAREIEELR